MATEGVPTAATAQSMVEKHRQKLYDSKLAKCKKTLKRRVPQVRTATRTAALDYTELDVDAAERYLRLFLDAEEKDGHRKRGGGSSERKRERERREEKEESPQRHRHHRRRRREKKRHRKDRDDRGDSDSDRDGDGAGTYGKYGILRESDLQGDKRVEFILWAKEVKGVEAENLARWEEKKLFLEFMDGYNTATLPGAKYYDLDAWRHKEAVKRSRREAAAGAGAEAEKVVFNDEEERKREAARARHSEQSKKVEAARRDLLASGKLTMMREQERLRAAQQVAYKTGDMKQARDIADILAPTDDDQIVWDQKTNQYRKKSKLV